MRKFFTDCMPLFYLPINWENVLRDKKGRMELKCGFILSSHWRLLSNFPENVSLIKVYTDN